MYVGCLYWLLYVLLCGCVKIIDIICVLSSLMYYNVTNCIQQIALMCATLRIPQVAKPLIATFRL